MEHEITLLNFTNVYQEENFYKSGKFHWIDCSDISGTSCYCDLDALDKINRKIAQNSAKGLHFIDSGNYHYISKLWTDKIKYPFVLIVFDHHPDMQPSLFDGIMSCGCWVKSVLDTNPYVQKVILVGVNPKLLDNIEPEYQSKLRIFSEEKGAIIKAFDTFQKEHIRYPVYISIDKDVLSKEQVITNWDQGSLTLNSLKRILQAILKNNELIGIDISGECQDLLNHYAIQLNNLANEEIMSIFDEHIDTSKEYSIR